jgi:hypothetical protein
MFSALAEFSRKELQSMVIKHNDQGSPSIEEDKNNTG